MLKALTPAGSMFTNFTSPKSSKPSTPTTSQASDSLPMLVAGMDISDWTLVQVTAAPGPLGILLDSQFQDAAVLDDFAPMPSDGTRGAVELDGRVVAGSVLVAVNEMDLLVHKLTLQEVGRVLRETSHQVRTLQFRVPPPASVSALEVSGSTTDDRVLLKGMDKSSYKDKHFTGNDASANMRGWNLKSLLSPTQIAGSMAALSGFGASSSSQAASPVGAAGATSSDPAAADASSSAKTVSVQLPNTATRSASLTTSSSSARTLAANVLAAKIPPGPIGLNLDGAITDRAVVVGFLPLPDGSVGELERRGDIPPGSVLVAINGSSVAHLTLDAVRARLGAFAGFQRELVFELPPQVHDSNGGDSNSDGAPRAATAQAKRAAFEKLGDLDKRRKLEMALVLQHDKRQIKRHECWFLIDTKWMNQWIEFTARGGVAPGAISNHSLLEHDWQMRLSGLALGRPDAPRAGLQLMTDYRCVTPMVWALFAEFHGNSVSSRAPESPTKEKNGRPRAHSMEPPPISIPVQARYVLDAYAEPLAETEITTILQQPRLQAAALANDLRERFPSAFT